MRIANEIHILAWMAQLVIHARCFGWVVLHGTKLRLACCRLMVLAICVVKPRILLTGKVPTR